jgi:very-short-patch-repair endonuclease
MTLLKTYFDINFYIKNNIPKVSIKIKDEFNKGKVVDKNGMPLSPSSLKYFSHHFNFPLDQDLYKSYKMFFNKKNALLFCLKEFSLVEEHRKLILTYLEEIDSKMKNNHKIAIQNPEYRKKLSDSYNAELQSKIKKERYKDPAFKAKMYQVMHNPVTKNKRILSYKKWLENGGKEILKLACNKPERISKISAHSKMMWQNFKYSTNFPKNYKVNNIEMNGLEYKIALILNQYNVAWNYEEIFPTKNGILIPDFRIKDTNKIIECYGDFWHANPKVFLNENQILRGVTKVKDVWNKDKHRQQVFQELGYEVLILWEQDINSNIENVKEEIRNFLNDKV